MKDNYQELAEKFEKQLYDGLKADPEAAFIPTAEENAAAASMSLEEFCARTAVAGVDNAAQVIMRGDPLVLSVATQRVALEQHIAHWLKCRFGIDATQERS